MDKLTYEETKEYFAGKSVAIVGSAPSCLNNVGSYIDGHDVVVRISNYKTRGHELRTGARTDVLYSFFGSSVAQRLVGEYKEDGVKLCMAKCPNSKPIDSPWHERNGKTAGIDFRPIYRRRENWWFCPTYIPSDERFMSFFSKLDNHVPTTGFACLLEMFDFDCKSIYVTGFDGFTSGLHDIDRKWRDGDKSDPIGHVPEKELIYLRDRAPGNVIFDAKLMEILKR